MARNNLMLPNRHWVPDSIGLIATLEKFNEAMVIEDEVEYSSRIFAAFLTLSRRHDLYTKGGHDGFGEEGVRFRLLLTSAFSKDEKEAFLLLEDTKRLAYAPPVYDEAEMHRLRKVNENVKRDPHNNPFKLFNDFKITCTRYAKGEDPDKPFELLVRMLYLIGKNLQKIGRVQVADERKRERDRNVASVSGSIFSNLVDFYFFGLGSYRIMTYGRLKGDEVLGPDVSYVEAQAMGRYTSVKGVENFVFVAEATPSIVSVAVIPRPYDIRRCDKRVAELKGTVFRRQLAPIVIRDVMMISFVYAATGVEED